MPIQPIYFSASATIYSSTIQPIYFPEENVKNYKSPNGLLTSCDTKRTIIQDSQRPGVATTANLRANNCKTPNVQDAQPDHFNNHRVQERMSTNVN